jgi:glycosyltransferase involved in cell wall biosynthesis
MNRGDIASVIIRQAAALIEAGDDVLVISGAPPETPLVIPPASGLVNREIPLAIVDKLKYDRVQGYADQDVAASDSGKDLADGIQAAMTARWGQEADVVHVHNPLIRKTAALLPALNILNKRGIRLLLQNHDMAEDFRPAGGVEGQDYPDNCHYAVINSRDYSFLHRAGLKPEGLHLIPCEVVPVTAAEGLEQYRYLYPVRAIRRKNIGEALLLSLFIPKGRKVTVTLPPAAGQDEAIYRNWVNLARELGLPVEFEAGLSVNLADLYGSALTVLTTSVREGFGFSFLDPWTAGRPVTGRRIDYVCRDFEEAGIRFSPDNKQPPGLYTAVNIPREYIAPPFLKKKMEQALISIYEAFGLEPPGYLIRMMDDTIMTESMIDFGRMDEELQAGIIRIMASNSAVYREVAAINPFLAGLADWKSDDKLIAENNQKIREVYGREKIAAILRGTYRSVMETTVVHKLSKLLLLELFLDPLHLSLVGISRV